MQDTKILIADDEQKIREVVKLYLEKEGFSVEEAKDGEDALDRIISSSYTLVLLDIMMPNVDGWTICREIRKRSSIPIIMLSARSEEYDKLFGFELGIDDYITKPFSPKEMVARVKAVIRRYNPPASENGITLDALIINPISRQVVLDNHEMVLTPKEFDLLYYLAQNPERVYSREQLLNIVWGYDFVGDLRTVDTHIKQLREKMGSYKKYIYTVWGTGYKFKLGEQK